jgi:hypothetical protein
MSTQNNLIIITSNTELKCLEQILLGCHGTSVDSVHQMLLGSLTQGHTSQELSGWFAVFTSQKSQDLVRPSEWERKAGTKEERHSFGHQLYPINWQSGDVQSPATRNALKRSTWFYADGHDTMNTEREREREISDRSCRRRRRGSWKIGSASDSQSENSMWI